MTKITVTNKFITEGEESSCEMCPIALAVRAACLPTVFIRVFEHEVQFAAPKAKHACRPLPKAARDFISRFDCLLIGDPFEFDLDIPTWVLKGNND